MPASQQAVELPKRKATHYLSVDVLKALKRTAYEGETNQSQVVEDALRAYISNRSRAGAA